MTVVLEKTLAFHSADINNRAGLVFSVSAGVFSTVQSEKKLQRCPAVGNGDGKEILQ